MVPIAMPAFAPGLRVALGASTWAAAPPASGGAESGAGARAELVVRGTAEVVELDGVVVREDAGVVLDVRKVVGKVIGLGARLLELVRLVVAVGAGRIDVVGIWGSTVVRGGTRVPGVGFWMGMRPVD
jgi:hypothetical protein